MLALLRRGGGGAGGAGAAVAALSADPATVPTAGRLFALGAFEGALYLHTTASADVNWERLAAADDLASLTAAQLGAIPVAAKGVTGGVATLGVGGVVPRAQLPQVATGTALETVYEVDFAALANQSSLEEGDVVIDGRTWTVANRVNAATVAIQNGSGIYLRCNDNASAMWTTVLTAPSVRVPLSNLSPTLKPSGSRERWIWARFALPHVPDAAHEQALLSVHCRPSSYAPENMNRWTLLSGYASAGPHAVLAQCNYAGTDLSKSYVPGVPGSQDVFVFRILGASIELYSGVWADGWPVPADLTIAARSTLTDARMTPFSDELMFNLAVGSGNTAGAADVLLKNLRVQSV